MLRLASILVFIAAPTLSSGCILDDTEDDSTLPGDDSGGDNGPADDPDDPGGGAQEECLTGCFDDGFCRSGDSVNACGTNGATCDVCGDGQACEAGVCVAAETSACSPANCAGCCDGDVCLSGTSSAACGSGGDACTDCGPRGICAEAGTRLTCEIDPFSRWNLVAISAELSEKKASGRSWDPFGGLPDPYAEALLDDESLEQTDRINNTTTPIWDQVIAVDVRASDVEDVVVEIEDLDSVTDGNDDLVGRCSLPRFSFGAFGKVVSLQCNNENGWKMRLYLEPND